ncbi:MFS transporter [Erwiniaceae bacterium BAC15a-03b]|uniref:MFS transporter n=1 Tax=Winslowiella arboricola TaxID=2978220 RepID=A0A9J6PL86_9GAMM|nr:MFS transporter [Winslowiella arboricola]MCU5771627.1 MFS transporter [Winslowiella arboricola]MCU5776440.1 MFS transporter [Winslowiella arboricola]
MKSITTASVAPVGLRERLSFGLGDYGTNLTYTLMVTFLAYYYTDVVGVSALLVGSLMFFARVLDGILCIWVGIRIDKTQTRYGKARPWVLWTAIPFGFSTFLLACVPEASYAIKVSWVCVTYLLANILFTANNIAYGSLLALITRDTVERGILSVFRKGLSTCGSLTVGVVTLPLIAWLGDSHGAWITVFAVYGFFTALFLTLTALGTRERIKPVREDNRKQIAFKRVWPAIRVNRYWMIIFFYLMITFTGLTAISTVSVYYSKYILQDISMMSWISVAQYLPGLLTLLVIPSLIKRIGKRNLALLGLTICTIAYLIPLLNRQDALFVIVATVIRSIGFCGIGATMFAFLADTIDYGEWKSGLRIEGILFSAGTLGQTVGMGLGTASVGWMLSLAGFTSGGGVQPASAIQMIQFLFIFFPVILALLNMILLYFYKLDAIYPQVATDLAHGKFSSHVPPSSVALQSGPDKQQYQS